MREVTSLINRIIQVTGYPCEYLSEEKPSLLNMADLPRVFVDTTAIKKTDNFGSGRSTHNDQMFEEDFSQVIAVQFCCSIEQKPLVWKTIGSAIAGWNDDPYEEVFTGLKYIEGGMIGRENGRVWWVDYWEVTFPRTFI